MVTRSTLCEKVTAFRANRWLLCAVLLITLMAGLDPKDYRFRNEVTWIGDAPGLRFGTFGRVHTGPFITPSQATILNRDGFTIEAMLTLASKEGGAFRTLATFHDGDDRSQLVLGQWRDHFIVMNGDDYSHRRRLPRITADTSQHETGRVLLTITTGARGTRIYLNGKESAANARLRLSLPSGARSGRLTIGNSIGANSPWGAEVFGFAVYSTPLAPQAVARHYIEWAERRDSSLGKVDDPFVLYAFNEAGGIQARDQSAHRAHLEIPARLVAIGGRALAPLSIESDNRGSAIADMTLNLFGFVPFGFLLAASLGRSSRSKWQVLLLATAAGLLLSLFIEVIQAWLPSRDSSQRDVLLNTAGTLLGALVVGACGGERASNRKVSPP